MASSGLGPNDSAIRLSDADERKIASMTSDVEIVGYLHKLAEQQKLVERDWDGQLYATPLALNNPNAKMLSRTLTINGETYVLEGKSDDELNESEIHLHRRLQNPEPEQEHQPRDERGQFISQDASEAVDNAVFQARWADAASRFMERHADYYRSDANRDAIGRKVIALGLEDAPTVASLETAYAALQQENGIGEDPEVSAFNQEVRNVKTTKELDEILAKRYGGRGASGVFFGQ